MHSDDETWFDALAGHAEPADAADAALQQAVRRAAVQLEDSAADALAERRLLARLEREGLIAPARPSSRWRAPRLAQAAVIVLCVGVVVQISGVLPDAAPLRSQDAEPVAIQAHDSAEELVAQSAPAPAAEAPQARAFSPEPARKSAAAPPASADVAAPMAGAMAQTERREAFAAPRAEPDVVLRLNNPAARWQELLSLVDKHEGLDALSRDDAQKRLRLRCAHRQACQALKDWLQGVGEAEQSLVPGQPLVLRLEARE